MATTKYLKLTVFPDIAGVYQKELRIAYDGNAQLIDTAIEALVGSLSKLAKVATTGSYSDLQDTPAIPAETPVATQDVLGKVKPDGESILIEEDGTIRAAVKVAVATTEAAGIIKPDGTTILVDENGMAKSVLLLASNEKAGAVIPDGDTILIDENGVIRAAVKVALATTSAAGIVKPDGTSIAVTPDGTIKANVIDSYTKAEVDKMLSDISELLMSENDIALVYSSMNNLMGESIIYSGLGESIIAINALADELLRR